ncbi:MAG: hypothetical protein R2873_14115 [Caldilineaceae bacterium]
MSEGVDGGVRASALRRRARLWRLSDCSRALLIAPKFQKSVQSPRQRGRWSSYWRSACHQVRGVQKTMRRRSLGLRRSMPR